MSVDYNNKSVQLTKAKHRLLYWIHQKSDLERLENARAQVRKAAIGAGEDPRVQVNSVTLIKPYDHVYHLAMADVGSFIGEEVLGETEDIGNFIHRIQLKKAKAFYKGAAKKGDEKRMAYWRAKIAKWAGKDAGEKGGFDPDGEETQEIINTITASIKEAIQGKVIDFETHQYISDMMMLRHLLVEATMPDLEFHAIEGNYAELQGAREQHFNVGMHIDPKMAGEEETDAVLDLLLDVASNEAIGKSIKRVADHYRCCEGCGDYAHKKCIGCHSVYYCGAECQKEDWANHSPECKVIASGMTWDQLDLENEKHGSIQARHLTRHDLDLEEDTEDLEDMPELEEIGAQEFEKIGRRRPSGRFRGRGGRGRSRIPRRVRNRRSRNWGGRPWFRRRSRSLLPYFVWDPLTRGYYGYGGRPRLFRGY